MNRTDKVLFGTCIRAFAFGAVAVLCKSTLASVIIGVVFITDILGGMWLRYQQDKKKKALNRRQPVKSKANTIYIFSIYEKAGACQDDVSI